MNMNKVPQGFIKYLKEYEKRSEDLTKTSYCDIYVSLLYKRNEKSIKEVAIYYLGEYKNVIFN